MTDEYLDHNHMTDEDLTPEKLEQLNQKSTLLSTDQVFHINLVTHKSDYLDNFVCLLKEAITLVASLTRFRFVLPDEFQETTEDQTHVNLNMRIKEVGFDYTCGIGTRLYRVQSASEHNIAFGTKQFQTLISSANVSVQVRQACLASLVCQLGHVLGLKRKPIERDDLDHYLVNQ